MRLTERLLTVAILLALSGCASAPRTATRAVQVERWRTVPIDARLLPAIEAPAPAASIRTNGDLWRAWVHDSGELGKCKPALDGIRALQPGGD